MKKLYLLFLFSTIFIPAQGLYVGNSCNVVMKSGALYYNSGGLTINGNGKIENAGKFMLVSKDGSDKFITPNTGGNFILKLNDPTNFDTSSYGQLYISGFSQTNLNTATIDKQYRAKKNGSMQQMSLPFYNKPLSSVASEIGIGFFSDYRNTGAIGYWENERAVMHNLKGSTTTTLSNADADNRTVKYNNSTRYYAVGTRSWDPSTPISGNYYTVKGNPFSDNPSGFNTSIVENLNLAGYVSTTTPISYGSGGAGVNIYNERYNSYLQDSFDASTQGYFNATALSGTSFTENGTFGRNIFQFGNPFFTNLDLSKIGYTESASVTDNNEVTNIQAIRYESVNVTTTTNGTKAGSYKFVSFNTDGTPAGDIGGLIIKPMQAFVIKLRNNTSQTLNFNTLRTFSNTPRADNKNYSVVGKVIASKTTSKSSISNLKQIRIIGEDNMNFEIGRTYYVVGSNLYTGHNDEAKMQITTANTSLFTNEEKISGDADSNWVNTYKLYINEANETDFYGKAIPLTIDNSVVSKIRFQIAENGEELKSDQNTLSNGEYFWYRNSATDLPVQITNNTVIPVTSNKILIYYGKPLNALSTSESSNVSGTKVAYNTTDKNYYVIFEKNISIATVTAYDYSGKLIKKYDNIKTDKDLKLDLDKQVKLGYIIVIKYDNGKTVTKKITY